MAGESCTIEPGTVTTSAGLIITCKLLYIDQYMYFFKAINIFLTVTTVLNVNQGTQLRSNVTILIPGFAPLALSLNIENGLRGICCNFEPL